MSKRENWIWMPHPAHFICSFNCHFILSTYVGKYIVSTVGEYLPEEGVREILAKSRGIELKGIGDERKSDFMEKIGYEEIGHNRKYETMVFKAKKSKHLCCPWTINVHQEVDMKGYNDADSAYIGHLHLCQEWSRS